MLGHYTAANGPLAWLSYYTTLLSGAGVAVFHDLMSFPSLETLLRRANYRRRIIVECFFFLATWPARYPVAHFLLVRGRGGFTRAGPDRAMGSRGPLCLHRHLIPFCVCVWAEFTRYHHGELPFARATILLATGQGWDGQRTHRGGRAWDIKGETRRLGAGLDIEHRSQIRNY